TYRNYRRKVIFYNLSPDDQGKLVINIKSSKDYNYLNGFRLTERFSTAPTNNAIAEHTEETGLAEEKQLTSEKLAVSVFPNPAPAEFTLRLQSSSNAPVQLRIINETGRVVEQKGVAANTTLAFGRSYAPGIYFVEVVQGKERKLIKLVKGN
ncbi:MAG TPA: T9SS type A sorting domain-containing protein, partial [Flavisolibacter sp.]|nr:T9SS type A sorting domain-containing protein [Flavisolibacter sp.]